MTVRIATLALTAACLALPACTTVNMAEMAGPTAQASDAPAEVNIVKRAVEKLKTAFTQRGFGPKDSRRKMHAAADVLLNGINREAAASEGGYAATPKTQAVVAADILVATRHVEQTTRAAEVYLEMVPGDRGVAEELADLEAALMVSEKAVRGFGTALGDTDAAQLLDLRRAVDGLRRITDDFGFRVRADQSRTSAENTAAS